MKISNFSSVLSVTCSLALVALIGTAGVCQVDKTNVAKTKQQIQQELRSATKDPLAMYNAVRTAGNARNLYWSAALRLLDEESQRQPENAIVRAGYVLCFNWRQQYPEKGFSPINQPGSAYIHCESVLSEAKRIAPDLWLTKVAEASNIAKSASVTALEEAVRLAPDISVTHYKLANAYFVAGRNVGRKTETPGQTFAKDEEQQKRFYEKAEAELIKAASLPPVDSGVWYTLTNFYLTYMPDKIKAREAWYKYLGTLPPQERANLGERQKSLPMRFKSKYNEDI